MRGIVDIRTWGRGAALALLGLALAARLLIAPGYMPVVTDAGVTVTLCTGSGPVAVKLPLEPHKQPPEKGDKTSNSCGFGALALAPLLPDPPDLAIRAYVQAQPPFIPARLRPHIGAAAPPPPSTGPPAFA